MPHLWQPVAAPLSGCALDLGPALSWKHALQLSSTPKPARCPVACRLRVAVVDDACGSLGGATEEACPALGRACRLVPFAAAPAHRLLLDAAARHGAQVRVAFPSRLPCCFVQRRKPSSANSLDMASSFLSQAVRLRACRWWWRLRACWRAAQERRRPAPWKPCSSCCAAASPWYGAAELHLPY